MTLSVEACREAADYLTAMGTEFAPVVLDEFREKVEAFADDPKDRSKELLALIENHDAVGEKRTLQSWLDGLASDGDDKGSTDKGGGGKGGGGKASAPKPKADAAPKAAPKGAAPAAKPAAAPAPKGAAPGPKADAPAGDKGAPKPTVLAHGDEVEFEHGDEQSGVMVRGSGTIVASGQHGATVRDAEGREHKVRHANLRASGKKVAKAIDAPLVTFGKAHVKGYTRANGTFVPEHDDKRAAAKQMSSDIQRHAGLWEAHKGTAQEATHRANFQGAWDKASKAGIAQHYMDGARDAGRAYGSANAAAVRAKAGASAGAGAGGGAKPGASAGTKAGPKPGASSGAKPGASAGPQPGASSGGGGNSGSKVDDATGRRMTQDIHRAAWHAEAYAGHPDQKKHKDEHAAAVSAAQAAGVDQRFIDRASRDGFAKGKQAKAAGFRPGAGAKSSSSKSSGKSAKSKDDHLADLLKHATAMHAAAPGSKAYQDAETEAKRSAAEARNAGASLKEVAVAHRGAAAPVAKSMVDLFGEAELLAKGYQGYNPSPLILFAKAHVAGYTRADGTVVQEHEDSRLSVDDQRDAEYHQRSKRGLRGTKRNAHLKVSMVGPDGRTNGHEAMSHEEFARQHPHLAEEGKRVLHSGQTSGGRAADGRSMYISRGAGPAPEAVKKSEGVEPVDTAPAPEQDPRGTYMGQAISALKNFWRGGGR